MSMLEQERLPLPTAAQLPRIDNVQMRFSADEDCWRLALFAGDQMIGQHFKAPAAGTENGRRRLELIMQAAARILCQQAEAATGAASWAE